MEESFKRFTYPLPSDFGGTPLRNDDYVIPEETVKSMSDLELVQAMIDSPMTQEIQFLSQSGEGLAVNHKAEGEVNSFFYERSSAYRELLRRGTFDEALTKALKDERVSFVPNTSMGSGYPCDHEWMMRSFVSMLSNGEERLSENLALLDEKFDHCIGTREEHTEDLSTAYDAFMKLAEVDTHGDDRYPFDIAGIYEDNNALVVLIVEGFENRYQELLPNNLPIQFGTATFSRRELDVASERLAVLMGDWNQAFVREEANQIIFSYQPSELEPFFGLDTDGSLWSYIQAVESKAISNILKLDLDQLKVYFTPKLMQNVIIEYGEPVTPD